MATPSDETAPGPGRLRKLTDPDLITLWASLRGRLALIPADSPAHRDIKRRYDAAKTEYRRRLDGELPAEGNSSQ